MRLLHQFHKRNRSWNNRKQNRRTEIERMCFFNSDYLSWQNHWFVVSMCSTHIYNCKHLSLDNPIWYLAFIFSRLFLKICVFKRLLAPIKIAFNQMAFDACTKWSLQYFSIFSIFFFFVSFEFHQYHQTWF